VVGVTGHHARGWLPAGRTMVGLVFQLLFDPIVIAQAHYRSFQVIRTRGIVME
jgi:hypothetical protein